MKRLELMPTDENILKSLQEDIFERNQELQYFIKLLNSIEGPYSIAVNGSWGSGKTFFVKQAKMVLDAYNTDFDMIDEKRNAIKDSLKLKDQQIKNQCCIYYDAWKSDCDLDPIYSLICSITAGYKHFNEKNFKNKKGLVALGISIMKNAIPFISNKGIRALLSILPLENIESVLESKNPLSGVKEQIELEEKIREFLKNLNSSKEERIIIFIDELDRCKPDFAVLLLERIKHYFDLENTTFVFSVNCDQLVYTIKKFYGEDFDAGRYLGRFFDQIVPLPKAELRKFYKIYDVDDMYYYDLAIREFSKSFNFSIRELVHYINMTRIISKKMKSEQSSPVSFHPDTDWLLSHCIIPILIGINIFSPQYYNAFILGEHENQFVKYIMGNTIYIERIHKAVTNSVEKNFAEKYPDIASEVGAVYQALFSKKNEGRPVNIGNYNFTDSVRTYVRSVGALMSGLSDFDYSSIKSD